MRRARQDDDLWPASSKNGNEKRKEIPALPNNAHGSENDVASGRQPTLTVLTWSLNNDGDDTWTQFADIAATRLPTGELQVVGERANC